jgi:hypothetical protein
MSVLITAPRPRKIIDIRHKFHQMAFNEVIDFLDREHEERLDPLYDDIGYMANFAVHANIPYRELPNIKIIDDKGNTTEVRANEFTRTAQNFKMSLMAPREVGLPWGMMPRIFILWLSTQAVETQNPVIRIGRTRSDFMQELGIMPTGGKNGSIPRFVDMMKRCVNCSFTVTHDQGRTYRMRGARLVSAADFVFEDKKPWAGAVQLTSEFFEAAVRSPVPVRWSIINLLRREGASPLAIDLYVWSTHRVFILQSPLDISFKQLRMQLGANYQNTRQGKDNFEHDVTEKLARVCSVYKGLRVVVRPGKGITLLPSPTSVPRGTGNFRYLDE